MASDFICGILLTPFMPESCEKLFAQIGAAEDGRTWASAARWGTLAESSAVTKGQVIGYVGNTGNVYSTGGGGYHLHLELRVNRARVNPLAYVPQ